MMIVHTCFVLLLLGIAQYQTVVRDGKLQRRRRQAVGEVDQSTDLLNQVIYTHCLLTVDEIMDSFSSPALSLE